MRPLNIFTNGRVDHVTVHVFSLLEMKDDTDEIYMAHFRGQRVIRTEEGVERS